MLCSLVCFAWRMYNMYKIYRLYHRPYAPGDLGIIHPWFTICCSWIDDGCLDGWMHRWLNGCVLSNGNWWFDDFCFHVICIYNVFIKINTFNNGTLWPRSLLIFLMLQVLNHEKSNKVKAVKKETLCTEEHVFRKNKKIDIIFES